MSRISAGALSPTEIIKLKIMNTLVWKSCFTMLSSSNINLEYQRITPPPSTSLLLCTDVRRINVRRVNTRGGGGVQTLVK